MFKELKKVYEKKKKELSGQQTGLSGIKGKKSLNPKHKQLAGQEFLSQNNLTPSDNPLKRSISAKRAEQWHQLCFNLKDGNNHDRAIRKSIERKLKKDKSVVWLPFSDLNAVLNRLRAGQIKLSERSKKTYDWLHNLKPNKFQSGCVAIRPAELKAFISGHNRYQCTELFICYLSVCIMSQSKSKFIFKDDKNYISHFGFNNSFALMAWAVKQFKFMSKIVRKLKALSFVKLYGIKAKTHKTGKVFYQLFFKSLNKWSKALTKEQKARALKLVKKFYLHKGLDPPDPVFYLGLDFKAR